MPKRDGALNAAVRGARWSPLLRELAPPFLARPPALGSCHNPNAPPQGHASPSRAGLREYLRSALDPRSGSSFCFSTALLVTLGD